MKDKVLYVIVSDYGKYLNTSILNTSINIGVDAEHSYVSFIEDSTMFSHLKDAVEYRDNYGCPGDKVLMLSISSEGIVA